MKNKTAMLLAALTACSNANENGELVERGLEGVLTEDERIELTGLAIAGCLTMDEDKFVSLVRYIGLKIKKQLEVERGAA